METQEIPLFPLHTVLFPGGPLPLRIFEPRYLDMVSDSLRTGRGFGICLIRDGREVGSPPTTHEVGTLATITDWHQRHDGLLGITVTGQQRFRIQSTEVRPSQLTMAQVEMIEPEAPRDLPADYLVASDLLGRIIEHIGHHYKEIEKRYGDAGWVSYRLSELLPIDNVTKQQLLLIDDPILRLERLRTVIDRLETSAS